MVCPAEEHVSEFLGFVDRWDRQRAGGRALLRRHQPLDRRGLLRLLRRATRCSTRRRSPRGSGSRSPEATPNARLVAIADEILGRDGRMVRAVEAIGRGSGGVRGSVALASIERSAARR